MSDRNKSVISGFLWRFAERCGAQGVSFIVTIVLARLLNPDVYGTISIILVFTTVLQVFIDSGMGSALIQKKNADDLDFSSVFFFNMIKSAIAVAVMFIVTKGIVGVVIAEILDGKNISNLSEAPAVLSFFAQDFMTNSLEPIYVTGVDIVICIIFMFLFATVMTFSSAEE